jgi:hypothetical protein
MRMMHDLAGYTPFAGHKLGLAGHGPTRGALSWRTANVRSKRAPRSRHAREGGCETNWCLMPTWIRTNSARAAASVRRDGPDERRDLPRRHRFRRVHRRGVPLAVMR